jgi:hypothetical protein
MGCNARKTNNNNKDKDKYVDNGIVQTTYKVPVVDKQREKQDRRVGGLQRESVFVFKLLTKIYPSNVNKISS